MRYEEKKTEEVKRKEESFQIVNGTTTKECSACKTSNCVEARFCQECGFSFLQVEPEKPPKPVHRTVQGGKEEKATEVKTARKAFFSPAQIASIRRSEEEMKEKEETRAEAVAAQEQKSLSEVIYVTYTDNSRIQKFTPGPIYH